MNYKSEYRNKSKYGNDRSLCALNHSHRSKLESSVCQEIMLRERAGELKLIQAEKTIYLTAARITYIADFECETADGPLFIEAKGYANEKWRLIRRLWVFYGPGPLEIYTGDHKRPMLTETIIPKGAI